jgi:MscS family membrane protein
MNPDYPPRVFFKDFKADSLNIFAIYWYFPPSYWDFMAHCEYVNLEILKRFNKAGIEFAFPTQTVYLAGDEKRKLVLKHDRLDEIFGKIDIKG